MFRHMGEGREGRNEAPGGCELVSLDGGLQLGWGAGEEVVEHGRGGKVLEERKGGHGW